jgi:sarcosine oxidase subunit beta
VIVGAGIVGCTVAHELARRGHGVVVLERESPAAGASGGPGWRGVRANARDPRELPLARRAHELWVDLGYRQTGHLQLTERHDDVDALHRQAERQRAAGIPSRVLDRAELEALEPDLADSVVAALWCERDGIADHSVTTAAMAEAARSEGAQIRLQTAVVELRTASASRDAVVTAAGEVIDADAIVIAANAGTSAIVDLPLFTVYPQVLVSSPLASSPVLHLIGHQHRRLALKTLPARQVMISGGWLGQEAEVDPAAVEANLAEAVAVYPALADAVVAVADASRPESVAPDLVPVVDRVPGTANAFVAAGWTGHGWALAPAVGEAIVEWITTGARPPALAPFIATRFKAGRYAASRRWKKDR